MTFEVGKWYRCVKDCCWWGGGASEGTLVKIIKERWHKGNTFDASRYEYVGTPYGAPYIGDCEYRILLDQQLRDCWVEATDAEAAIYRMAE